MGRRRRLHERSARFDRQEWRNRADLAGARSHARGLRDSTARGGGNRAVLAARPARRAALLDLLALAAGLGAEPTRIGNSIGRESADNRQSNDDRGLRSACLVTWNPVGLRSHRGRVVPTRCLKRAVPWAFSLGQRDRHRFPFDSSELGSIFDVASNQPPREGTMTDGR